MKSASVLALSLSLAYVATACGALPMQTTPAERPYTDVKDNPNKPARPHIKRNPHPTAYEITLTIENAPGPFGSIRGFMQYETALDDPCMPDLGGMAGTRMRLIENIPVTYKQVTPDTYRATVYTDLLIDEDYYDLGVCHWSMIEARVELKASDGVDDATFVEGLSPEQIADGKTETAFFPKKHYPRGAVTALNVFGMREGTPIFAKWPTDQLFNIKLSAKKSLP